MGLSGAQCAMYIYPVIFTFWAWINGKLLLFICFKHILRNSVMFQFFQKSFVSIHLTTTFVSMLHSFWNIIMLLRIVSGKKKLSWSSLKHGLFDKVIFHFSSGFCQQKHVSFSSGNICRTNSRIISSYVSVF